MFIDPLSLWKFLPVGYLLSISLEIPILLIGLSKRHSLRRRVLAGLWLTACTYPIVILVLPLLIESHYGRTAYVITAESFAPLAECLLFWMAFDAEREPAPPTTVRALSFSDTFRDMAAVVAANLCSWLLGGWLIGQPGISVE